MYRIIDRCNSSSYHVHSCVPIVLLWSKLSKLIYILAVSLQSTDRIHVVMHVVICVHPATLWGYMYTQFMAQVSTHERQYY